MINFSDEVPISSGLYECLLRDIAAAEDKITDRMGQHPLFLRPLSGYHIFTAATSVQQIRIQFVSTRLKRVLIFY